MGEISPAYCLGFFFFVIVINTIEFFLFSFLVFLPFLGPLPWHMEVPRLGAQSEL